MATEQEKHNRRIQRIIDQTARDFLKMRRRHALKLEALKLCNHEEQRDSLAMLADGIREQVEAAALRMMVDHAVDCAQQNSPSVDQALAEIEPEVADE